MAAASYTTDLTDWIADSDTTAWGELTGAIAGGAPDEADTESALQGTNTVSQSQNTTGLCSMCRILGTPVTFSSGQVALVWHGHGVATALATYANNGLRVAFATTLADWKSYTVAGGDTPPFPYGKWVNSAVDPSLTADATNGTPPTGGTNIYGIGSMSQLTQAVAKGQPHVCDMIRYGRAEARISGGDLANGYATFAGFAAVNDTTTNRWGLIQNTTGGFQWKGLITLGYVSAVDFRTSNVNVFIQDCRKVSSTFNKIEIRQASSRVDWTNVSFINASPSTTASKGALEVIDNADVNIDACTFVDMDTFIFQSNSTVLDSTFRRCGQVTLGGGTFEGVLFDRSTATSAVSTTSLNLLTGCTFISDGTGHAVNLGTIAATTSMNWNNTDTGYAGSNGSTGNETILVNVSSGQTLTINVGAGYTTPTYYNTGTGTVTVVSGQVTTTITVIDAISGTPQQNARVYLKAGSGGPLSEGTVIFNTPTDSNGQVTDIRSLASDQPVVGWVRKSSRGSLRFDSDTDRLNRTANLPSSTAFTVLISFQRVSDRSGNSGAQNVIMLNDSATSTTNMVGIRWVGTSTLALLRKAAGTTTTSNFASAPAIGEWVTMALTCSGSGTGDLKGYWFNAAGALVSHTFDGVSFTPAILALGYYPGTSTVWVDGKFAQVRVWNAALTVDELRSELGTPAPVRTANLNTAFVDDGFDISGNGRNWTMTDLTTASDGPYPAPPFYKTSAINATIDNAAGLLLTVLMIKDE